MQIQKKAKFGSESIKYWNRETTYKRGKEASAMGFSRGKSDAYVRALDIVGSGRAAAEAATQGFAAKRYVDEGGGARSAGRNVLLSLLAKTAQIDKASDEAMGKNLDIAHQGLQRKYVSAQMKNRARLGVPPEWGAPVMMPPKDKAGQFLATLKDGLSIATSIVSLGTSFGADFSNILGKTAEETTKKASTGFRLGGFLGF
jgi:hypothetical protein